MKRLINFEFRKLFKAKSFYVCLIVCLGLVLLSGLTTKILLENSNDSINPTGLSMLKGAISAASITLIAGIFTALFVCEDETSGTIKNIYAKGYSRRNVYFAKYIVSLVSTLIFTLASMLLAYLFGTSLWEETIRIDGKYLLNIFSQLILIVAYHSIFFAISSKIGKTGSSIAFNIVGPMFVGLLLSMGDAFLKTDSFKLTSYWIDSLLTSLQQTNVTMNTITPAIILGILYSVIFVSVGYLLNKKKEI